MIGPKTAVEVALSAGSVMSYSYRSPFRCARHGQSHPRPSITPPQSSATVEIPSRQAGLFRHTPPGGAPRGATPDDVRSAESRLGHSGQTLLFVNALVMTNLAQQVG